MVKVNLLTTGGRKSDMFAEHQTPREILEYFGVDYGSATNTIDGVRLSIADMNKSLRELGVGDECRISSIVKIDNAAHVDISGASAVLVSDVDLADWKKVEKYEPDALRIIDEEGNTVFRVMTGGTVGTADNYGVCFGDYTNGGKATVTALFDTDIEDKTQAIKDMMGNGLLDLNEIEEGIPAVLEAIAEKEAKIEALINAQ